MLPMTPRAQADLFQGRLGEAGMEMVHSSAPIPSAIRSCPERY